MRVCCGGNSVPANSFVFRFSKMLNAMCKILNEANGLLLTYVIVAYLENKCLLKLQKYFVFMGKMEFSGMIR